MIKNILAGSILGLGIALAIITSLPNSSITDKRFSSIIRLHDISGRFFCSAVVVSDTIAITAAHCIQRPVGFFQMALSQEPIRVYLDDGLPSFVYAFPLAANGRADVGVIQGDFRNFKKSEIETDAVKVYEAFTSKVTACGFPWGGKLTCFDMEKLGKFYFSYTAKDGSLYPGMSGGPVFNSDGKVVGINSAVSESANILAPIVEIEEMLNIKL